MHEIGLTGGNISAVQNIAGSSNNANEEFMSGGAITFNINPAIVPEPASMLIWFGLGAAGLVSYRRRKIA